jgi:hypothetical protein
MQRLPLKSMLFVVLMAALPLLAGCGTKTDTTVAGRDTLPSAQEPSNGNLNPSVTYQQPRGGPERSVATRRTTISTQAGPRRLSIPAGTKANVSVNTAMSTENASVGDQWTGEMKDPIVVNGKVVVPAGATVSGRVTEAVPAKSGTRATLRLAASSVDVNGHVYAINGDSKPIVAGSPRARNIGAIAGGTAAGAVIGHAVGKSGKGTIIGGLLGGAAAGAAVAKSKGYQVDLKSGTAVDFTFGEGEVASSSGR